MKEVPFTSLREQYKALELDIKNRIGEVLHHGQFIMGPEVQQVEGRLAEFTDSEYCITAASGTDALLMSLMALGVGPGDEVITSAFSFISTVEVIVLVGATPVFVDICLATCNIDEELIEAAVTPKTKAIIPVSLYGQPPNMSKINEIAERNGAIPVIEDAAQSFGASQGGHKSCNLSTLGCTSFFPSKPLGCYGDGGAIFTRDEGLARNLKQIRVHGQTRRYYHERIGVGGRMDTLQCAILLAKLERFPWEVERRIKMGDYYNRSFDELGVRRVRQKNDSISVFGQYTIFVENRDSVQKKLAEKGIPTTVHYPLPLNEQPAYRMFGADSTMPAAKEASSKVLSLPFGPDLDLELQNYVIQTTAECLDTLE